MVFDPPGLALSQGLEPNKWTIFYFGNFGGPPIISSPPCHGMLHHCQEQSFSCRPVTELPDFQLVLMGHTDRKTGRFSNETEALADTWPRRQMEISEEDI